MFGGFFFGVRDPFYFGDHSFLSFNPFFKTFTPSDVPIGRAQVLFGY